MSTVWKLSRGSGALEKCECSGSKNVIGVSQSATQTVADYKAQFFESAKKLGLLENEMLLAKWFREGLCEEIKREVRKTTKQDTMEKILRLAYAVETRIAKTTAVPEESVDKHIILCEDEKPEDGEEDEPEEEEEDEPEDDPEEEPAEEDENNEDDAYDDPRFWDYDDNDQWGVGTPPH